jgi:enamine deaminase RidA (YjgF/YER057c/UK114 family)
MESASSERPLHLVVWLKGLNCGPKTALGEAMKNRTRPALALTALAAACATEADDRPAVEHFPADAPVAAAGAARGFKPPFSSAVRVKDVLYLSGQIGVRPDR